uniref:Uncharacterized protein n=1 Tax=Theileria annulata TaxID=5874 RepID=A0A3B0N8V0_THEAN
MDSCKSAKLVDSFDNSFYSEKNLYKKDQNLSNSLGDNLVYELKQLDSTLDDLFLTTNQQLNTHYSIHKFRLKVSRRISSFSSILKSLSRQCESLSNSQQRVKLFTLHQFYNDRLMKHKNRLSEWWSRNERRYHDLYLSSFVSHMKNSDKLKVEAYEASDFSDNGDSESDEGFITKKLKDTRNMMISQINQMDAAEPSLLKSSQYITQQVYILNCIHTI